MNRVLLQMMKTKNELIFCWQNNLVFFDKKSALFQRLCWSLQVKNELWYWNPLNGMHKIFFKLLKNIALLTEHTNAIWKWTFQKKAMGNDLSKRVETTADKMYTRPAKRIYIPRRPPRRPRRPRRLVSNNWWGLLLNMYLCCLVFTKHYQKKVHF